MKWLLIGGSRGIGKAIQTLLITRGDSVHSPTRDELDLSSMKSVLSFQIPNAIDGMILCAGVQGVSGLFETMRTEDLYDRCFQVNFLSHAILTLRFVPRSKPLIYVSSEAALNTVPDGKHLIKSYRSHSKLKSYAASKCLYHVFVSSSVLSKHNIRCANPGHVNTSILDSITAKTNPIALVKRFQRRRLNLIPVEESAERVLNKENELLLKRPTKNSNIAYQFVRDIVDMYDKKGVIKHNHVTGVNTDHLMMTVVCVFLFAIGLSLIAFTISRLRH